jgi:hypothetical protein
LSDLMAEAPPSGAGSARYLLVACYVVGGLVSAAVLGLLALLAVDGHPLPLLAAAVGAVLPLPLQGMAYLLGVPRPARDHREGIRLGGEVFAHDYALALNLMSTHGPSYPVSRFSLILRFPGIWYRHWLLRLQHVVRFPGTHAARDTSARTFPSEALRSNHVPADITVGISQALSMTDAIATELSVVNDVAFTRDPWPDARTEVQEEFLAHLAIAGGLARDLVTTIATIRDLGSDLDLDLALELAYDLASAEKLGRNFGVPGTKAKALVVLTSARDLTKRLERHLRDAHLSSGESKDTGVSPDNGE